MNLIAISDNILVNPERISCVEQRNVQGTAITYVWIDDRDYILTVPLDKFLQDISMIENEDKQIFAG